MTVPKKDIQQELLSFFRLPEPLVRAFFVFLGLGMCFALYIDHLAGNPMVIVNDYLGFATMMVLFFSFESRKIGGNTALTGGIVVILYLFMLGGIVAFVGDPGQHDANLLMTCLFTITMSCILELFVHSILAAILGLVSVLYILTIALLVRSPFIVTNLPLILVLGAGSSCITFFYRRRLEGLAVKLIEGRMRVEASLNDLQNAQKRIVTQEKLATLGALVSGISHELRNPLNFINNFSGITQDLVAVLDAKLLALMPELPAESRQQITELLDEIRRNLGDIAAQGERGTAIIQSMLMHHRGAKSEAQATDLNALVRQGSDLALQGYRAREKFFNLNVVYDLDPRIGAIQVIPHEINRVIINLCSNAFYETHRRSIREEATGYQPRVFIQTRLEAVGAALEPPGAVPPEGADPAGGEDAGNQVVIRIRDNAWGIPAEFLDRIFLPFFTSKPTGDGTGLGLSIAWEIITSGHNGSITATNHPEGGAEFIITLPALR